MGFAVCGGAVCACTFGMAPSTLVVTPEGKVTTSMPIARKPALNQSSKCMCSWGGVISITSPGTMTIQIP